MKPERKDLQLNKNVKRKRREQEIKEKRKQTEEELNRGWKDGSKMLPKCVQLHKCYQMGGKKEKEDRDANCWFNRRSKKEQIWVKVKEESLEKEPTCFHKSGQRILYSRERNKTLQVEMSPVLECKK